MAPKPTMYFFVDTETGGLTSECSLLTFDGTLLDENLNVLETIAYKIKPDDGIYHLQAGALKVNKINIQEHDLGATPMSEAKKQFERWASVTIVEKYSNPTIIVAGQNVWYDIEMLKKEFCPNWGNYFSRRILDLQPLSILFKAAGLMPAEQRISLSELVKYFNIDIDVENMHRSDVDVFASIEIFKKYIRILQSHPTHGSQEDNK